MTDDIVARLRALEHPIPMSTNPHAAMVCNGLAATLEEAAAEIERLRAWLVWIAVDDTDAQAALQGKEAPK